MVFLLIFCLLATFYFQFILKIEIIFTHIFYVPIILAGLWWSRKGIAVAVFLALLLLISHVLSPLDTPLDADVTRALMFVIVGTVVSILNEKWQILEDKLSKTLEHRVEERTGELREAQEKQRAILDGIGDAVIVLDRDQNVTWSNEIAVNQYGAVNGRKCYETYKWLKEPCPDCIARETYVNGVAMTAEEPGILKDGTQVHFIVSCSPVRNSEGKVVSVVRGTPRHHRAEAYG
ncbi:MAG: PAS domain-containing protein [Methanosarcinales archaeon]